MEQLIEIYERTKEGLLNDIKNHKILIKKLQFILNENNIKIHYYDSVTLETVKFEHTP